MSVPREVADDVITDCRAAAAVNHEVAGRRGSVVELDAEAGVELMVTADLHGNRLNFQRLLEIADLPAHPRRHLLMQEVCHGGPLYPSGQGCMSHLLLEDVVRLKLAYPDRFHFILSNHELAELTDYPISKNHRMLNLLFRCGLHEMYGERAERVREAYCQFLASCPLGLRLASGVFVCHSLPEQTDVLGFDTGILRRKLQPSDLAPHGPVFRMLWGRDSRPANAAAFARLVEAELLVNGHEPCSNGFAAPNPHQIILDCCGRKACYLMLPLDQSVHHAELVRRIRFIPQPRIRLRPRTR